MEHRRNLMEQYRKQLKDDGYVVIPNLMSSEEVQHYRRVVIDYFGNPGNHFTYSNGGKGLANSFAYIPELCSLLADKKIKQTLQDIVGTPLFYLHHSDIHYNRLSSWHKDTDGYIERPWDKRSGEESFSLYKIAFYLQDHIENNHGLTVRKGSHLSSELNHGEEVNLQCKVGDAVFFDQRISHVGQQFNFSDKVVNRLFRYNQKHRERVANLLRKAQGVENKLSIFWGVGVQNEFSREFAINTIKRQNKVNGVSSYTPTKPIISSLSESNMGMLEL